MSNDEVMQAAWFDKFGPAKDVLNVGELERPVAGPGEVLVRLHTSGVNPSDVKKRAGSFPNLLDAGPVIPNSDGAGIIEAVGDGVDNARIGERVWVYQAQFARQHGTAAEYIAIDESRAPRLAENASFEVGACLGIPAMTAHRCVFADGDVAGRRILITGGAGRVGHYAIQWASRAGAIVIATASNDDDSKACIAAGAQAVDDHRSDCFAGAQAVVDHRSDGFAGDILDTTGGEPVDRVIDVEFGANLETTLEVIRVGGTIATYSSTVVPEPRLPFFQMMYKDLTARFVIVYAMPESAKQFAIADIELALNRDELIHRVAGTYSLSEIASANECIESGSIRGCVILTID